MSRGEATRLFDDTVGYWRGWLAKCTYQGRWREIVHRSAMTLKLLTYAPTGALVAAPTHGRLGAGRTDALARRLTRADLVRTAAALIGLTGALTAALR